MSTYMSTYPVSEIRLRMILSQALALDPARVKADPDLDLNGWILS